MHRNYVFAIWGALGVLGFAFIYRGVVAPPSNEDAITLFTFSFLDRDREPVELSVFAGQPIVLNFWASWCPFCKEELPDFALVAREFADRVRIIAVNRGESFAAAEQYLDKLSGTAPLTFLFDPDDELYRFVGGFSMPETIFVDRAGTVVFHKRGFMDAREMRERIEALF